MPVPAPTPLAMRRMLRRARDGATLNVDEATTLLQARGDDLADLCSSAAKVRDAGLLGGGQRPKAVTYSRKGFRLHDGVGVGISVCRHGDPRIYSVLRGCPEGVPEGGAFVVVVVEPAFLRQRDDLVDEGVDAVLVDVDGDPEPIAGTRVEPFLQVVRGDGRSTDRGGVVV